MNISGIGDVNWPPEVQAVGLVEMPYPLLVLRDEKGKWFHAADFYESDFTDEDEYEVNVHVVLWVRES